MIEAFKTHPKYFCYAPFVEFLFLTGRRTSEAIGLMWKHINPDCSKITFSEAVVERSAVNRLVASSNLAWGVKKIEFVKL